jgi:hypothetical protein
MAPELTWQEALALRLRVLAANTLRWTGFKLTLPRWPVPDSVVTEVEHLLELGQGGRPLYWCPCRVD